MSASILSPPPPPPPSPPVCNARWDEKQGHCGGGARREIVDPPSSSDQTDGSSMAGLAGATSHGSEFVDVGLGAGHDDSSSADVPPQSRTYPTVTTVDDI